VLVEGFGRAIGARAAALAELRGEGADVAVRAAWTADGVHPKVPLVLAYENALARAIELDRVVVEPLEAHPVWGVDRAELDGRHGLVVPLKGGATPGGLLADVPPIADRVEPAIETALDYAAVAALCLRDAVEIDALEDRAVHDSLTGCLNRAAAFRAVAEEIARARRYGSPLSVCFLDVDDFKRVNDEHGHLSGDRVLRGIAAALRGGVRANDLVARVGGDEFLVLMPQTDAAAATAVAERLVIAIETIDAPDVSVSAQFGIAGWTSRQSPDDLVGEADRVLLERKESKDVSASAARTRS
jgi:diguanylate cyclase (GGDEF)-like protein